MAVQWPPYSGGGGGGGGVASVNGDVGPAVVLDAADVGALPDDYSPVPGDFDTPGGVVLGKTSSGAGPATWVTASFGTQTVGTVVTRGPSGMLQVTAAPTAGSHVANKQYVDDQIAAALADAVVSSDGSVTDILAVTETEMAGITPDATTVYNVVPG